MLILRACLKSVRGKMTSENQLQKRCLQWLREQDSIWYLKVFGSGVQTGGVPDILLCKKGKFVAIELKRPDGKGVVHPRQEAQIRRIRESGGTGEVIDNFEDFVKLMEGL